MKPAVREVDELLALGVSVTVYNGQVSTKDYSLHLSIFGTGIII